MRQLLLKHFVKSSSTLFQALIQIFIIGQFIYKVLHFQYKMFFNYLIKLFKHNENLDTPLFSRSLLENLKQKHNFFEVQIIESKITR